MEVSVIELGEVGYKEGPESWAQALCGQRTKWQKVQVPYSRNVSSYQMSIYRGNISEDTKICLKC